MKTHYKISALDIKTRKRILYPHKFKSVKTAQNTIDASERNEKRYSFTQRKRKIQKIVS